MKTERISRPLAAVATLCLLVSGAQAQAPTKDLPLAYTVDDKRLKWGPCPEFLPKGCQVAVLHGDPAKPNVDIFFKVPGKSKLASHKHTSAERMVLVSGELHVMYEGQDAQTLRPGDYAYGPAERPHRAHCAAGEPCILFIAFEEPVDAFAME